MASPSKRLPTNVEGDFFVDSSCIDCGTCRWMAGETFDAEGDYARVHTQPRDAGETRAALEALVACPTGSIGTVEKHDVRSVAASFPIPVAGGVYHCGFHHEDSFGAASYLIVRPEGSSPFANGEESRAEPRSRALSRDGGSQNILVDSPRLAGTLLRRLDALGGVDLMFLTHRDDVAEHERLAARFGCPRVLHRDDVSAATRAVEIQPRGTDPVELGPDLLMIPVPGHTRGSACLLYRETFLFSGDHLAWSLGMQRLYAFHGACWYDWDTQIESMQRLAAYDFEYVLPGHGAPHHAPRAQMRQQLRECIAWMRARR